VCEELVEAFDDKIEFVVAEDPDEFGVDDEDDEDDDAEDIKTFVLVVEVEEVDEHAKFIK
jgi:hypothetical protein